MAFVPFTSKHNHFTQPTLSVWPNGQVSLSSAAIKQFNVDAFAFVQFSHDASAGRVGLRFTNDTTLKGLRTITRRGASRTGAVIGAKQFFLDAKLEGLRGQFALESSGKSGCDCCCQIRIPRGLTDVR